jgi:hypothetical protein
MADKKPTPTPTPPPGAVRDYRDAKMREEEEKRGGAPTPGRTFNTKKEFAKGGFVRSADGIAQRGKTRGKIV